MKLSFAKYSGCGNDFIFIDNREKTFPFDDAARIQALCCRHKGIGADGLVLLEDSSSTADMRMRIFNKDGSEAAMCGNALRCALPFMRNQLGWPKSSATVQTMNHLHTLSLTSDGVTASMAPATNIRWDALPGCDYLNTGVPHLVFFVKDIAYPTFLIEAKSFRNHVNFAPEGTNVNAVALLSKETLALRTFERGVEGETLACGTGATAAALVAHHHYGCCPPITIIPTSGEKLIINFSCHNGAYTEIAMTASTTYLFSGILKD